MNIVLDRVQLEAWAGRPLTDADVRRLEAAIPNSSIPEAIAVIVSAILPEPWCNHDAVAVTNGVCECGVRVGEYDHAPIPDDMPEPGDRCKVCGEELTWMGPSPVTDWLHVNDPANQ